MRLKPQQWAAAILVLGIVALVWVNKLHRHAATASAEPADSLQLGQLTLKPCEIGGEHQPSLEAYCTEFEVAENHDDANSRQIKLKVAVVKSETAQPDSDLVTFIDGGPGGAATEDYPAVAAAFAPLRRQHHVLLVDQRGTGGSNSLDCPQLSAVNERQNPEQLDELANDKANLPGVLRACLQEISGKADPQFYSTTDAVQDLEALRVALGSPRLNLVGVSYGTRVAQQYATRYPHAVRSIVLDSPVPNSLALGQDHARNLDDALKAQFEIWHTVLPRSIAAKTHKHSYHLLW